MYQGSPAHGGETLYRQVADWVEGMIQSGTFRPGERIPSVRGLSRQRGVSVTTVLEAYRLLEDRRLVEARPQSGYYVRRRRNPAPEPHRTESAAASTQPDVTALVLRLLAEATDPDVVPLGAGLPCPEFLPVARMNRILARVLRRSPELSYRYGTVPGNADLRAQIARRALEGGSTLTLDDVLVTAGAQEAVHLCLRAVCRPGDTVAVETPTYYGLLEAIETLHLRAIEIATHPREGVCLEELADALQGGKVAACAFMPCHGNPTGHRMPDEKKSTLVALLAERRVPLIEDDVYGELGFDGTRPRTAHSYDTTGNVLLCSSFSKTLAPGYRIGWAAPGRFRQAVERLKFASSVASATPTQMAVAEFLRSGGFDRHLRRLRGIYRDLVSRVSAAVTESFPPETRMTRPEGGHFLWVEMPPRVDAGRLHEEALAVGVSIVPGPLFSATGRYRSFMRLNCAVPWTPDVERGIQSLGRLVHAAAGAAAP